MRDPMKLSTRSRVLSSFFDLGLKSATERRNMFFATVEGSMTVTGIQIMASFIVVYLLRLGGTTHQLGLVTSLPFLMNALAVILAGQSEGSPRKMLGKSVWMAAFHRVFVIALLFSPVFGSRAPEWIIVTHSLSSAAL